MCTGNTTCYADKFIGLGSFSYICKQTGRDTNTAVISQKAQDKANQKKNRKKKK